jgi:hypothetical protein
VFKSGANTVQYPQDDASEQNGRGSSFTTLSINNGFGNTDRFTDKLGTQIYADGIILDWAYWNQVDDTVAGIPQTPEANLNLRGHLDAQPFTIDGYSDWYVMNIKQLFSLANFSLFRSYFNYAPFNLDTSLTINRLWSSTMENVSNGIFMSNVGVTVSNQSATNKTYLTRNYTMAELGL